MEIKEYLRRQPQRHLLIAGGRKRPPPVSLRFPAASPESGARLGTLCVLRQCMVGGDPGSSSSFDAFLGCFRMFSARVEHVLSMCMDILGICVLAPHVINPSEQQEVEKGSQWFQSRWHRPQDVLYMGVHINHRHWGLCHWSSQSTINGALSSGCSAGSRLTG